MKNEALTVKITNGVAASGLVLPVWWPTLNEISAFAATLVPILSAIWLVVQIVRTLRAKPKADAND